MAILGLHRNGANTQLGRVMVEACLCLHKMGRYHAPAHVKWSLRQVLRAL